MILRTAETASLRAVFPKKPLQFLRIQAIRDLEEAHEAETWATRQKPAFMEDLDAPVLIEGQPQPALPGTSRSGGFPGVSSPSSRSRRRAANTAARHSDGCEMLAGAADQEVAAHHAATSHPI